MKLYHGSNHIVSEPHILTPSRTLDYGSGLMYMGSISQDNLYLLLPGKVMAVAEMYARHHDVTLLEAMRKVYASDMYKHLEREDTKYWHLGTVALYQSLA